MTLKEYRLSRGLSQKEMAKELSAVQPGIDASLISKIENGICEPTPEVQRYVCKPLNRPVVERKLDGRYIYHSEEKNAQIDDFDPIEEIVLGALKVATKQRPITRATLRELTGMKDSHARDYIGRLRDRGYRIVGSAGRKGYWIAETEAEYKAFRAEYDRKAKTYLRRIAAMDAFTEGQVKIDG